MNHVENKYDEVYDFRLASYDEIPKVMQFIDTYWQRGHILGNNRDVFEWQYVTDSAKKRVNMALAIKKKTGEIHAALGFIPASFQKEETDIWGALWKARDDITIPFLGMELHKRLQEMVNFRYLVEVGLNPGTSVRLLGRIYDLTFVRLNHYYMLSDRQDDTYKIAHVSYRPKKCAGNHHLPVTVRKVSAITECEKVLKQKESGIPYKDGAYVEWRYFRNPFYRYDVYVVETPEQTECALIVGREQEMKGSLAYRIMDYIGSKKLFAGLGPFFEEILAQGKYEYIDFYNYGLAPEDVFSSGMTLLEEDDKNIIPDHFYPFEQKNIELWGAFPTGKECMLCKADADQDRPNKLSINK